jgi:hypothetical protein
MAHFRTLASGKIKAEVHQKGITNNKTFATLQEAQQWAQETEAGIHAAFALPKKELLKLTPEQIDKLGGADVFRRAGKRLRYKSFLGVCTEYIDRWKKKDIENQLQRVAYWADLFGNRPIQDIDIFDVRDHIDDLVHSGQRTATVNPKESRIVVHIQIRALTRLYRP